MFLSACCFAIAGAAGAARDFAAVGACAFAIVYGVAAFLATRQFFNSLFHSIASATKLVDASAELSFRNL
jgi:hypothetical protein